MVEIETHGPFSRLSLHRAFQPLRHPVSETNSISAKIHCQLSLAPFGVSHSVTFFTPACSQRRMKAETHRWRSRATLRPDRTARPTKNNSLIRVPGAP